MNIAIRNELHLLLSSKIALPYLSPQKRVSVSGASTEAHMRLCVEGRVNISHPFSIGGGLAYVPLLNVSTKQSSTADREGAGVDYMVGREGILMARVLVQLGGRVSV